MAMLQQTEYTDEDIAPLVSSKNVSIEGNNANTVTPKMNAGIYWFDILSCKFLIPILVLSLIGVCFYVYEGEYIIVDKKFIQDKQSNLNQTYCKEIVFSISEIKERFSSAKHGLVQRLKVDYGKCLSVRTTYLLFGPPEVIQLLLAMVTFMMNHILPI
jgi:hypothetical protein